MNIHVFLIFSIIYILIKLVCKILDCSTKIINTQVFWSMHACLSRPKLKIRENSYSIIWLFDYFNIDLSEY